jgi:hypothetical protein
MSRILAACSLLAVLALPACGNPAATHSECQSVVEGMLNLMPAGTSDGTTAVDQFDVNSYFTVLDHLKMREGHTLDWVYTAGELQGAQFVLDESPMGAQPVLYARRLGQARLRTYEEYNEAVADPPQWDGIYPSYLDYVDADGTDESFLQLAILSLLGERFFILWHAAYGDIAVVCDHSTLDRTVDGQLGPEGSLPPWARFTLRWLRLTPVVKQGTETTIVRVVTFSRFEGFVRRSFFINKGGEPRIAGVKYQLLLPYDVGIVY